MQFEINSLKPIHFTDAAFGNDANKSSQLRIILLLEIFFIIDQCDAGVLRDLIRPQSMVLESSLDAYLDSRTIAIVKTSNTLDSKFSQAL